MNLKEVKHCWGSPRCVTEQEKPVKLNEWSHSNTGGGGRQTVWLGHRLRRPQRTLWVSPGIIRLKMILMLYSYTTRDSSSGRASFVPKVLHPYFSNRRAVI